MREKERNSGLELLRIIAIFMIICIHAFGLVQGMQVNYLGQETTRIVNCICNMGVSCFVLISGYFGVKRDWKKIVRLEMMTIFYSFCTTILLAAAFPEIYQGRELLELLVKSCIPVISRKHWFYTCYICLLLLSPWLNEALERMTKQQLEGLLLTMLCLFSICPSFFYFEIMQDGGKGLINMILLYILGRYIRKYGDFEIDKRKAVLVFAVLLAASYVSSLHLFTIGGIQHSFIKDNSIVNIGMAVILLYLCKNVKWQFSSLNRIAAHIFGIYILNVPVLKYCYTYVLRMDESRICTNYFPFWMLILVGVTFLVCLLCDVVRQLLFGGLEKKLTEVMEKWMENKNSDKIEQIRWKCVNYLKKKKI